MPTPVVLHLSRELFRVAGLLERDGNTFGPEFEEQYAGHRNYFYYMNRNQVVPGAEGGAHIFELLDGYTRQVPYTLTLHHTPSPSPRPYTRGRWSRRTTRTWQ